MENRQPVSLEEQLKQKDAEIAALKKKLEDRNPAFNGNLLNKADKRYQDLCETIGKVIHQQLGPELANIFKNKKMKFCSYYDEYVRGNIYRVDFLEKEDEKKIKDQLADIEMKKFQESLDNFAWAVQNQGGQ